MLELQYLSTGMSDTQVAQDQEVLRVMSAAADVTVRRHAHDGDELGMFRSMLFGEMQS